MNKETSKQLLHTILASMENTGSYTRSFFTWNQVCTIFGFAVTFEESDIYNIKADNPDEKYILG